MIKIIKYGFVPVKSDIERGQNNVKGLKLFQAGHVLDVTEKINVDKTSKISGRIVAQTRISNVYEAQITERHARTITSLRCVPPCPPPRTCENRNIQYMCAISDDCSFKCVCDSGYYRKGTWCVRYEECDE
ncbi:uncharacterized protein LOC125226333 [Leguminivora glycinivorella]|uniref:uncharacterized protein LOC125226333 n=1 Tax=Leguminivora glycinivorella TaxID=1035111 RepID=UPI00200F485B|nr:uncharacterized protein LOC125226333 [Leguminivora glycinivorella]